MSEPAALMLSHGASPIRSHRQRPDRAELALFRSLALISGLSALAWPPPSARRLHPPRRRRSRDQHQRDQHETVKVVADHLSNPRGLSLAPGGLYLARAGSGGAVCVSGGEQGETCLGLTGSFDLVRNDSVKHLVSGLISGSGPSGVAAEGPVSVSRGPDGSFYGQFGLNSRDPAARPATEHRAGHRHGPATVLHWRTGRAHRVTPVHLRTAR